MSSDPRGKPWCVMGTPMVPQVLLAGKLFFLLLLLHGFTGHIKDPYLPFISIFDYFHSVPGIFATTLLAVFIAAGAMLLFNIAVRPASVLLGLVIVLERCSSY